MTAIEDVKEIPVTFGPPPSKRPKLDREIEAFYDLLPELLQTHRDQFVAIHEGRVLVAGSEMLSVAAEAHRLAGNVELLVRKVTVKPPVPVRILSPRLARNQLGNAVLIES